MSERKWLEVEVTWSCGFGALVQVRSPKVPDERMPRIAVPVSSLRDAPDDEQLREERDSWRASAEYLKVEVSRMESLRDDARDRVAELERELDEVCQERDGAQSDLSTLETRWTEAKRERDEARREAEDLGTRCQVVEAANDAHRAENERLRARVEPSAGERVWAAVSESFDEPDPQTHYRENDLVLAPVTGRLYRLKSFLGHLSIGAEEWLSMHGRVAIKPAENPILERDGIHTDEGLQRLAERAFGDGGWEWLPQGAAWRFHNDGVYLGRKMSDALRRKVAEHMRLHVKLREMGDA